MVDVKTVAVALVAFGLGSVVSANAPLLTALSQPASRIPVKVTKTPAGMVFEKAAAGSDATFIVLKTKNSVVAYQLGQGYVLRGDRFGECGPPSTCPLPPPCPPAAQACPWESVQVSFVK